MTWGVKGPAAKGQSDYVPQETSFSGAPQHSRPTVCLPSQTSLEICLAANMLWKALISYLSRSSVLQDNKLYLIFLCSLMSQLKGLVLPLSMRRAESIFFFSLVNAGLRGFWSMFKMRGLSPRRSYIHAHFCQQHTVFDRHHYKQWDM